MANEQMFSLVFRSAPNHPKMRPLGKKGTVRTSERIKSIGNL